MKIKLYNDKTNYTIPTKEEVCLNRGVDKVQVNDYLSNSSEHINSPFAFDEELLRAGAKMLISTINSNKKIHIIVDSDCDGYTSAAIMINYLHLAFPAYTDEYVSWSLQEKKVHGLNPFIDILEQSDYSLIICPDSSTNDIEAIDRLYAAGKEVLILDHHLSDVGLPQNGVIINSQYNYPNKELSGAGVVWQFCRYLDSILNTGYANELVDLAAVGCQADMMSLLSIETKELIFTGLKEDNIKNPLIYYMCEKNEFAMTKSDYQPSPQNELFRTPISISFFVAPLINACTRVGTMEEKDIVFKSMLLSQAFKQVLSTKRGHKQGEMEQIVTQAVRQLTNIKNRQEKLIEEGLSAIEGDIKKYNMLEDKALVFTTPTVDARVRGLIMNKLANKYQRPGCIVSPLEDGTYGGSMRGYTMTGISDFKAVAESSDSCIQCPGHENSAGCFLTNPDDFRRDMNEKLKDISTDIVYYCDYIYDSNSIDGQAIIDLAEMNDYIGQDFQRPQVYIKNCQIFDYLIMKDKHLKINLPGCDAIIWDIGEDMIERLKAGEVININFVAKCAINGWGGNRSPQLMVIEYEEIEPEQLTIAQSWGF